MRQRAGTATQLSPIARKQRQLAGFGALGVSAPNIPIGQGAGKGAESGAVSGASLGTTIMPGIGTAIGAVVGAVAGAIAGAIGKQDPEIQNFNQAIAIWQQNPDAIYKLANKYLVLAGIYVLNANQAGKIRIYRKYGRMGEEPFTRDFAQQIYKAAQTGAITPQDSAASIYQKVILPWEDSWGFGPEPPNPHSDFMDRLLTGMILDYATGYGPKNWFSRSGPLPASFASIPPFQFPGVPSAVAPVPPAASSSQASAPTTVLSTDGSTVTKPGTALKNASGQLLYFGAQTAGDPNNVHGYPVWVNGAQNGYLMGMMLANQGQVYGQNDTNWFQWTGANWNVLPGPPQSGAVGATSNAVTLAQPTAPATVLTGDGSTVTSPGTALKNASGQLLYFGAQASNDPNNIHGYPVWVNGAQNGYLLGMLLVGGQVYGQNDTNWFQWSGSGWNVLPGPPQFSSTPAVNTKTQATTPPASTSPSSTAVSVPTGFALVGTANNLQAYLGPDGLYYSWSGATMTPLTGQLTGFSGSTANVISGQIQSAPTVASVQSQPSLPPPMPDSSNLPTPAPPPVTLTAPVPPPVTTSGIPAWAWLGVGVAAFYMFSGRRRHA